ncbi:MAG: hypothetical protein UT24_C0021G0010, partial [Candidatus Woesebacteria bacterium GW2011_GWB1_39_12]
DSYLTSTANGAFLINGTDANFTNLNIGSGTANFEINNNVTGNNVLFNTTNSQFHFYFNETSTFHGTVNTTNITLSPNCADNQIIKWSNGYGICQADATGSASVMTNGSDANFTLLNVYKLNGTETGLFNKSISLVNYNQSISLDSYNKSISLVNYNQSISLVNYLTTSFLSAFWQLSNLTNYFGDSSFNSSVIRVTNSSWLKTTLDNTTINRSISLDSYNKSISLVNYNYSISLTNYWNIGTPLSNFQLGNVSNNTLTKGDNTTSGMWNMNGTNLMTTNNRINVSSLSIVGNGNGVNFSLSNGSGTSVSTCTFSNNGSGVCICGC